MLAAQDCGLLHQQVCSRPRLEPGRQCSNLSAMWQVADRFRGNLRGIVIATYITTLLGFGWFAAACVGW